jgi:selenide,water dikinase
VKIGAGVDPALVDLCFDAETSGGLLIAIAADRAADLERELAARGLPVARIGRFTAKGERSIEITP